MRPIVSRILDGSVVSNAELVEQCEQFTNLKVVFDHAIGVLVVAFMAMLFLHVRAEVRPSAIPPAEKRLASSMLTLDEVLGRSDGFFIDGFHAILGEWTRVFDGLTTFAIGETTGYATRPKRFPKGLAAG